VSTSDTFFTASGSSPPAATDGESQGEAPAELVEALVQILASALVADMTQYPNLADLQAKPESTVESPSGHARRERRAPARPPRGPRFGGR
jgi:hypothetical protein